ncbi:MAG: hypothetical protein ACJ0BI_08120 [Paracoccaceae bacterium]
MTLSLNVLAFSEEILEEDFFDDDIELELEEDFYHSEVIEIEDVILEESQDQVNSGESVFDLIQSSITFGNFISHLSSSNSSKSKLILNMSSSPEIAKLGFLDISANFEIDSKNKEVSNDLMIFNVQNSLENVRWKLGKYRKTWGDVDGTSVLDVINPAGSILSQPLPGLELPSRWLGETSVFIESNTFEIFFSFKPDTLHAVNSTSENSGSEIGFKSSFDIERGQLNFYLGSLFPRVGVINVASGLSDSSRYNLVGISAHKEIENYLVKFDLAKKINLKRSTASGIVEDNRTDAALGIEYAPSTYDQLSLTFEGSLWVDSAGVYYIPGSSGTLLEETKSLSYNVVYSRNTVDEKLNATISVGGNMNGSSSYLAGESTYSISDYTKIKANILLFEAEPNDPSYSYDNSKWINLGITRYF